MMKFFLTLMLVMPGLAWAQDGDVQARLIAGANGEAALEITMTPGWHTYWKVPGDSGLPPRFDWSESKNVQDVHVHFPAPERKKEYMFYTFGYTDQVTFPLDVQFEDPEKESVLSLKAQILICKDICITAQFESSVPIPAAGSPENAKIIKAAQKKIPVSVDIPALKIDTVVAGQDALVVRAFSKDGFEKVDIFATTPDLFSLTLPPEITPEEKDPRYAMIRIPKTDDFDLIGKRWTLTLVAGDRAIEKDVQL